MNVATEKIALFALLLKLFSIKILFETIQEFNIFYKYFFFAGEYAEFHRPEDW